MQPPFSLNARSRALDLAAVSPLMVWYGLGAYGLAQRITSELSRQPHSARLLLEVCSETVTVLFFGLQLALFVIRRLPQAKEQGLLPRLAAAIGMNGALAFLALPRVQNVSLLAAMSQIMITTGTLLAIGVASWLGRRFSIFPHARALVTSGPYRKIRHPLYLSEALVTLGAMWQFKQPGPHLSH